MIAKLTFLGATGTVTGSKYLLDADKQRILVDCGLFQGLKRDRLKNWAPLPVDPKSIDAVVLTHAHLDHTGYLPLLIKNGFSGPVYCTEATADLAGILLPDSGHLQEKDAEFANRHRFSKHHPALPLYTAREAEEALTRLRPAAFDRELTITPQISIRFRHAGHILGAAIVLMRVGPMRLVFSGDLGRPNSATMLAPDAIERADYLVVESTYGDRIHDARDPEDLLSEIIRRTAGRGGTILIPAFAVGRTQELLFHLERLKRAHRIPNLPIFLDSPMAIDATDIFTRYPNDHRLSADEARRAHAVARYCRTVEESKELDANPLPKVIISASGMATGGRVLHHLKQLAPDERNTILFSGFQAAGTRGASMMAGADTIKIHGSYVPVRAEVQNLHMLSAHADSNEIIDWLRHFSAPPRRTFITHGEPAASDALRHRIEEELGWTCLVPEYREEADLSAA